MRHTEQGDQGVLTAEELLERFRRFCLQDHGGGASQLDPREELDWRDLSLGFFKALGASDDLAWELATAARYVHHYWIS